MLLDLVHPTLGGAEPELRGTVEELGQERDGVRVLDLAARQASLLAMLFFPLRFPLHFLNSF